MLARAAWHQRGQQHGTCLCGGRGAVCTADGHCIGCQERAAAHQALQATHEGMDGGGQSPPPPPPCLALCGKRCVVTRLFKCRWRTPNVHVLTAASCSRWFSPALLRHVLQPCRCSPSPGGRRQKQRSA